MAQEQEDLRALLQQLRNETLPSDDIYHVIHELGRAKVMEAVPDIARFLTDKNPEYRYVALEVLSNHFRLQEYWTIATDALHHDPSEHVRIGAAAALVALKMSTKDVATLRELAQVVVDEAEDELVRQAAWSAILGVINWNWEEQRRLARRSIDLRNEVDWGLVRQYVPPT